ncbi:MAG: NFACT RNA binding domain-containing protein [Gemmatimonadaceae bacterium]
MDSVTAHYLARELDASWRGRRVTVCEINRDPLAVRFGAGDGSGVRFDLAAPDVRVVSDARAGEPGLLAGASVIEVRAPTDDRRIEIVCERAGKFRGSRARRLTLEISMLPAARGATLREAGAPPLQSAGATRTGRGAPRPVLDRSAVQDAARRGDRAALLAARWVSPLVAGWLLARPDAAGELYEELCALPSPRASRCGARLVPFAWCDAAEPVSSLIAPEELASVAAEMAPVVADPRLRALARMRRELDRAAAAPVMRQVADALMGLAEDAPLPPAVALPDGSIVPVTAREGEGPIAAAERLYREVRSMERAQATLPERIAAMQGTRREPRTRAPDGARGSAERSTPSARAFRTYRSSGGLDIWVGRGAQSNDELTFHESSPDDVWLHARDAAGAHVILRWQRDDSPPPRDLEDAAMLAAWHSRNRGSTVVPVDWTRRKYVRKPRGGAPGLVLLSRAETIFVRPSAVTEKRLRDAP